MATTRPGIDLLDPELYRRNPHDLWTWMRANEPLYRDEKNGLWGVSRHADVMDIERRSSVFSSKGMYRAVPSPDEVNMIAQDDPRHRQQRMLVQPQLTRHGVAARTDAIAALVRSLADDVIGMGEFEVVAHLAGQLPARLTATLLGFPEDMWPQVKSWSERLMRTDMRERDAATMGGFIDANREFMGAAMPIVQGAVGCPFDGFMSTWANARIDGEPMTPESIMHEIGLFIAGGAETTRTAISHGLRAFCDHPAQWDAMADDPALVEGAVEEVLRWVTPLNNFFRTALVDDEVGGRPVRAGDRFVLLYPSANRDEDVFDDPFTFDIRRNPNPHLAFGFGTHLCVGANLARLVLRTVFTELSARVTGLEPVTEPDVEANIFARAVRSFTLRVHPR